MFRNCTRQLIVLEYDQTEEDFIHMREVLKLGTDDS